VSWPPATTNYPQRAGLSLCAENMATLPRGTIWSMTPRANYAASLMAVPLFVATGAALAPQWFHDGPQLAIPVSHLAAMRCIFMSLTEYVVYGFFAALSPNDDLPTGSHLTCVVCLLVLCCAISLALNVSMLTVDLPSSDEKLVRSVTSVVSFLLLAYLTTYTYCSSGRRYWLALRYFIAELAITRLFATALLHRHLGLTAACPPGNLPVLTAAVCNLNSLLVSIVFLSEVQRHRTSWATHAAKLRLRLVAAGGAPTTVGTNSPDVRFWATGVAVSQCRSSYAATYGSTPPASAPPPAFSAPAEMLRSGETCGCDRAAIRFLTKPAQDLGVVVAFAALMAAMTMTFCEA